MDFRKLECASALFCKLIEVLSNCYVYILCHCVIIRYIHNPMGILLHG